MDKAKSYEISKHIVQKAYEKVRSKKGSAGIDNQSIEEFEKNLKDNLYKIWNRMSSGTYFPPAVKSIDIAKKSGGTRTLGIPTVSDRIAQMIAKLYFEPKVEPHFLEDSYGYRPKKSAIDAVRVTRERCWKYDWVLEFDIKGLFDNIDHELLMKAVEHHTEEKWLILYIERWLKAPFEKANGERIERSAGTPQGGVISPVLANLFLHYAFDKWMERTHPNNQWARYADDGIVHCRTKEEAQNLRVALEKRLKEVKLELHPTKTKIIYCKDKNRKENHSEIKFDFLGYTYRPRVSNGKHGMFVSFSPAISNDSKKAIRQEIKRMKIHFRVDKNIIDLSKLLNPKIRGWINYYGKFCGSELNTVFKYLNGILRKWARKKYKSLKKSKIKSKHWMLGVAKTFPNLFVHWEKGILGD